MGKLILASGSPYRQELLKRLVSDFEVVVPNVDEDLVKDSGLSPLDVACRLARMKATAVAEQHPGAIVIGSDQLVDLGGRILGKPHTVERACQQLLEMSGRYHRLLTAVCIIGPGGVTQFFAETGLWMRTLEEHEAAAYVRKDNPLDCAGSYRIEGGGIALFEKIETTDFTAIMGLPLMELGAVLRAMSLTLF